MTKFVLAVFAVLALVVATPMLAVAAAPAFTDAAAGVQGGSTG